MTTGFKEKIVNMTIILLKRISAERNWQIHFSSHAFSFLC